MVETARNYPPGASPDEIWAILREVAESQKELTRKMAETDRQMEETGRRMKETDKKIGEMSNRFGELAEHLVAPNIKEKFNALGFTFVRVYQNLEISDTAGNHIAELDLVLENGDIVMIVEIKAKPKQSDVDDHIKRLETLRRNADTRYEKRAFQGAIAGAIMSNELRDYVTKKGFYAIEQTGDTVKISVPEGFKPRQW